MIGYLEAAIRARGVRQSVIAHNIANAHTPGFRRKAVRFEEMLAEAMASGRPRDLADARPEVFAPRTTPVDGAGNDVDLNREVGELVKNDLLYKAYLRMLAGTYRKLELAMGGPK